MLQASQGLALNFPMLCKFIYNIEMSSAVAQPVRDVQCVWMDEFEFFVICKVRGEKKKREIEKDETNYF